MYKALESFCGEISMFIDEVRELDESIAMPLLEAGLIEKVAEPKKPAVKKKQRCKIWQSQK